MGSKQLIGIVFTLPALLFIIILTAYPIYETFLLSFSKLDLATFNTKYIGWANYKKV
ncbi:unnamed protein product, partial [marine sediment metagenome]